MASWWPASKKRNLVPRYIKETYPGFVSERIMKPRMEMYEAGLMQHEHNVFGLNRTMCFDRETTLHFIVDRDIKIEIYIDRSVRLVDRKFRVAASFNTANETSIIHPLLRASVTNLYIQGMCAPLTEFNRFTGLFRIDSFDKNTPLVSSKEYAINFTTVEKLKYNCMYTLDRVSVKTTRPVGFIDFYHNFSKNILKKNKERFNSEKVRSDFRETAREMVSEGNQIMYLRGYEVVLTPMGSIIINDLMALGSMEKVYKLEYNPTDLKLEVLGHQSWLYANFSTKVCKVKKGGASVYVKHDICIANAYNNKAALLPDGTFKVIGTEDVSHRSLYTHYAKRVAQNQQ
ncbi:uncharacterized protein LOC124369373 [Homalodisca vitripennis]|uniref:uncharacterized protein LOC124369373 n=1 Tax=Homalodisca vitripennis TaxID=197043 RepID=UPI001EEBAA26|nr:uncharacterized protein LOC124369373 [Homalodisca vitripennis]XP_046683320.1 uncharacterized protein LOC124369373 [Homalodisca vitripennis]XP_046683321.1 uncharacterized protein LOC124369373 [Homalodisca vitripennis]XP_046683322.1 uncharacterized protein LOC124369373 [Homalodisca vitripennis]XP_046683324.1 uncharacterized protein LOC124369373 [Homalodisca vitripennis]XP_046683325.1 uncharacterized protein LOC124369373 [Homalodisca vitripennis]XP_046683326.1 uncharacterized protein LOC12436